MDVLPMPGPSSRGSISDVSTTRQRRVRTGCLTCRKRHLKCDEALPFCLNCRKSNRKCRRGIRLNFIDTTIQAPPRIPRSMFWHVTFQDESRDIASEYRGGLARYNVEPALLDGIPHLNLSISPHTSTESQALLPSIDGLLPAYDLDDEDSHEIESARDNLTILPGSRGPSIYSPSRIVSQLRSSKSPSDNVFSSPPISRRYLDTQEDVLLMQVYVEEVGLWMDSLNSNKHFSELLPSQSLDVPMLMNAFLACGARHLTSVNANYSEDRALHYYDTATTSLLNALKNPNRDMATCATTAVILNVYEIMCENALQRMNHIAGARALIKECGWNAKSEGIGAACFWLNIGMELLSNLHFNWQLAWDPDDWGLNMDFSSHPDKGREEIWAYRMIYIIAKVANFRAIVSRRQELTVQDETQWISTRFAEWEKLNNWCDVWNDSVPRTMQPMGYLHPHQTSSKSAFPEVWIVKRIAIVARLFYHTAKCLLAQTNPLPSGTPAEMKKMQESHSRLVCGIVAHVKDRGVASVSLRSLAIASECLTVQAEQEEVLQIFSKIQQETGWRVGFVRDELKEKWGWINEPKDQPGDLLNENSLDVSSIRQRQAARQQTSQQRMIAAAVVQQTAQNSSQQQAAQEIEERSSDELHNRQSSKAPSGDFPSKSISQPNYRRIAGILNPMLSAADFSMPQHPYQSHYVAPNSPNITSQFPH